MVAGDYDVILKQGFLCVLHVVFIKKAHRYLYIYLHVGFHLTITWLSSIRTR